MIKSVNILGVSGSIGTQSAEVIKKLGYRVRAISVSENTAAAKKYIAELHPEICAVENEELGKSLQRDVFGSGVKIICGDGAAREAAAADADVCINAISGFAGLLPTISALSHTARLAIANKETLVAAGFFVKKAAKENGVEIIPVDSEHSAIFQCLAGGEKDVKRLILTCSGGAFYKKTKAELENVSLASALGHPTWNMGGKITVDCATLMNKGLEVIEAMHLFDMPVDKISVVIHRESIIHSMVEYVDNAVIAQLGTPDMRLPIQYALTYPDRAPSLSAPLDLAKIGTLTFDTPDTDTFPSLALAYTAARTGGNAPCVMNAANEVAVKKFMQGKIRFPDIYSITKATCDAVPCADFSSIDEVVKCHEKSIETANEISKSYNTAE